MSVRNYSQGIIIILEDKNDINAAKMESDTDRVHL